MRPSALVAAALGMMIAVGWMTRGSSCARQTLSATHDEPPGAEAMSGAEAGGSDGPSAPGDGMSTPGPVGEGGAVTSRTVTSDVARAATEIMVAYREAGNCVLADAGYLDLLGNVWSCTVQGDGWVELCTVRALDEEGGGSEVLVTRMAAREWEAEHDREDGTQ